MIDNTETTSLNTNAISLIALCHQYCTTLEQAVQSEPESFCRSMLQLLPRIYITVFDLKPYADDDDTPIQENDTIYDELDEDSYIAVRDSLAALMGEHDTFLDTNVEDMKYSDTPIASSVSECLADLYQSAYNFVATVRESPTEILPDVLADMKWRFTSYWGDTLCNVLRIVNSLYLSGIFADNRQ